MIKLKEAESDYIKIGKMILPKNAADMGYADYSTVARKAKKDYEAEKEAERKEKERQEYAKKGEQFYNKLMEIYTDHVDEYDIDPLMADLFHAFVPSSGPCETLGAEFIRAIERIRYRAYNDGDKFYSGYGLETCASDAAFLAENSNDKIESMISNIAERVYDSDTEYEKNLDRLAHEVVSYLVDTPEVFGKPTMDSRDYDSYLIDEWKENSHYLEYEPDVSGEWLDSLIDRNCISWEDVENFLSELTYSWGGNVNPWALDAFTITDLDEEQYAEWEQYFPREFEGWLESLIDEYGEYDEEDEEDEEDEDY